MIIKALNLAKRFGVHHIIRDFNQEFASDNRYAVTGPNGSGKSTLLKVLAGIIPPSKGKVIYQLDEKEMPIDSWFRYLSITAPYMDLIEDLNLEESLAFHQNMLGISGEGWKEKIISELSFKNVANKPVKDFSSGMKQKVKLCLSFHSQAEILFLDEPMTNLDKKAQEWYLEKLDQRSKGITIIFSNRPEEYQGIQNLISLV